MKWCTKLNISRAIVPVKFRSVRSLLIPHCRGNISLAGGAIAVCVELQYLRNILSPRTRVALDDGVLGRAFEQKLELWTERAIAPVRL
ncbi:MAG: hypothetical protein PUP91_18185 [Rhizonema sp. PD37]|nr:hypothetical protein [Rhizonema sp. PD37]